MASKIYYCDGTATQWKEILSPTTSNCTGTADPTRNVANIAPTTHGSSSTGTCQSGFSGAVTYTCNAGTFSFNSGSCDLSGTTSCPARADAGRHVAAIPPATDGNSSTGTCDTGYTGAVTYTCSSGTFNYASGTCTASTPCAASNDPARFVSSIAYAENQVIRTGTCQSPYVGGVNYVCNNGTFTFQSGTCHPTYCPGTPDAARRVSLIPYVLDGQISTGTCSAGYTGNPAPTYTCNNGTFTYTGGSCIQANPCTESSDPTRHVSHINYMRSGESGTASCASGYYPPFPAQYNQPTYRCDNGTFIYVTGSCGANCAQSSDPANFVTLIRRTNNGLTTRADCSSGHAGNGINYTCDNGTFIQGTGVCCATGKTFDSTTGDCL